MSSAHEAKAGPRQEALGFLALLLGSRLALLLIVGRLVGGDEYTDDAMIHLTLASEPLRLLLGRGDWLSQYPPLLPIFEALAIGPLQAILPRFYALRLAFIGYEVAAAACAVPLLRCAFPERRRRRVALAALALLPTGFMTSTIMAQDESIAAFFLMLVLLLVQAGRPRASLFCCGLGVVSAKIFLLLPLAALLLGLERPGLLRRALWGLGPVLSVYAIVAFFSLRLSEPLPLVGFHPNALGVNAWVLAIEHFGISAEQAHRWSAPLAGGAALALLAVLARRQSTAGALPLAAASASLLLVVFALFYHVHPEYFLLVLAPLLLARPSYPALAAIAAALTLPWAVNFFHAILLYSGWGGPGGKAVFVALYRRFVPVAPGPLYQASLWCSTLAIAWLALWSVRRTLAQGSAPEKA